MVKTDLGINKEIDMKRLMIGRTDSGQEINPLSCRIKYFTVTIVNKFCSNFQVKFLR